MASFLFFTILFEFCSGYVNLALNKPTWQPSNFDSSKWFASAAVDGDKRQNLTYNSCAVTKQMKSGAWRVDLGSVLKIHFIDIYYRYKNQTQWESEYRWRMAGFFLYVSNTTKREDGYLCFHEIQNVTHPPTSYMSIPCEQYGRYVIYYNERNGDGVQYPTYYSEYLFNELCEVEVYACDNFTYGSKCTYQCGNCRSIQTCDPINGDCSHGCPIGWRGQKCAKCPSGTYGIECNQTCSMNCQDALCDHVTGNCTRGCEPGWQDFQCNKGCEDFYFGDECAFMCGRCLNGKNCNHENGICQNGCDIGWQGERCDKVCSPGSYGLNCSSTCSGNCNVSSSNLCDHVTGSCIAGCKPGWQDNRCDKACDDLFYGENCNLKCGACRDGTKCNNVDGICPILCAEGWYGKRCDIDISNNQSIYQNHNMKTPDSTDSLLIGAVVGWVFSGICVLSLIVGLIFYIRRKSSTPKGNSNEYDDINMGARHYNYAYSA